QRERERERERDREREIYVRRDDSRDRLRDEVRTSPHASDYSSTSKYRYESHTREVSPQVVSTTRNESSSYTHPRRASFETRGAQDSASFSEETHRREASREYSAERYRSDSRNGYRVESPASTSTGILRNADPPRPESRSESLRSVQILRKTFG
ncbi:hypothetical protein OESDEN_07643, partial [Oesophagostomum dentatum]